MRRSPMVTIPARAGLPLPRSRSSPARIPRLSGIVRLLGLADADVDMIRNVGTVIDDDSIRSLVISTRVLGTREIMIINHDDCGMLRFTDDELEDRLRNETGVSPIAPARFYSFTDPEQNTGSRCRRPARIRGSRRRCGQGLHLRSGHRPRERGASAETRRSPASRTAGDRGRSTCRVRRCSM